MRLIIFLFFQVRGKSETVRITDESFEDDPTEVDEMEVSKINDDMVKKLLVCDNNGQKNEANKGKGPKITWIIPSRNLKQ